MPLVLLAFPLFLSVDLDNVSSALDNVINVWKILSTLIVVLLYLNRLLGRNPGSSHTIPMILVMLALLASTIVNSGSFERYLIVWGGFLAVALLVEAHIKQRPLQLLLALKIVLGIIAVVNLGTVIAWPGGLWSTDTEGFWLLGHRNNFGTPLIAAVAVAAAYDFLARRRLTFSTLLIGAGSIASVLLTWSASSVVTVVLAAGAILLVGFTKKGLKVLRPFVLLVLYVIADVGIVIFQIQERFGDFITNVLDRSTDLTGRTRIWDLVLEMVAESPLLGNGVQLTQNNGLVEYNRNFVHAHNGELDILMQGGLLTFIPFAIMVLLVTSSASRFYENRIVQVLFIGLILVMFRAITGLFFSSYAVLLVFLLLNSDVMAKHAPLPGAKASSEARKLSSRLPWSGG